MTPLALALILISAILHATRDFLTKRSTDKQIFIWWCSVFSLIVTIPAVIYLLIVEGMPNIKGIMIAMQMSLVHFCYWLFYTKAYDGGDLSHVYPIIRSSPAFILIFAVIFLQEKVTVLGVIGIICVSIGIYILNVKTLNLKQILDPVTSIFKDKHIQYAFLALFAVTIYSLVDKVAVSYINPVIYGFILTSFTCILFSIYLFKAKTKPLIKNTLTANKKVIIINSFIAAISYPLILTALTISNVSYVAGFRQISVVFAVLLGGYVLKEKYKTNRIIASIIIFIGAVLISIA